MCLKNRMQIYINFFICNLIFNNHNSIYYRKAVKTDKDEFGDIRKMVPMA